MEGSLTYKKIDLPMLLSLRLLRDAYPASEIKLFTAAAHYSWYKTFTLLITDPLFILVVLRVEVGSSAFSTEVRRV